MKSVDFSCHIQIVGSQLGVDNWRGGFLAHFGHLHTEHQLHPT